MKSATRITSSRPVLLAALAAAAVTLSSCGSMYPSSEGRQYGKPQTAGWTTTSDVREAEQKSIARDMPFAAVTASGDIVQR